MEWIWDKLMREVEGGIWLNYTILYEIPERLINMLKDGFLNNIISLMVSRVLKKEGEYISSTTSMGFSIHEGLNKTKIFNMSDNYVHF